MFRLSLQRNALPALLLASLCACSGAQHEDGIQLRLEAWHRAATASDTEPGHVVTAQGTTIALNRAYLNVSSVEVFACARSARLRRALQWLRPVRVAHAHSAESPTRSGAPHVADLLSPEDQPLLLGTLRPPAKPYCGARVVFGPADSDAAGLPPDGGMIGHSVYLEGLYDEAAEPSQPFTLTVEQAISVDVDFTATPLTLSAAAERARLSISITYGAWFDGVDWSALDASERLAANVAASTTLSVEPY